MSELKLYPAYKDSGVEWLGMCWWGEGGLVVGLEK